MNRIIGFVIGVILLITLWYLTGYLPGRPIKRKRNRWHAWGPNDQIWGFIDGDKTSLLPDSMPLGFRKQFFELTYSQYVEDGNMERYELTSKDGQKIIYHKAQVIDGIKKPIRNVTEMVTRIRKTEIHPFIVTVVMPRSGMTFYLSFTAKIQIIEPMKILKLDNFLSFIGNELSDAAFPWAVEQEEKWINENIIDPAQKDDKAVIGNIIIDKMIGLKIDSDDCIMIGTKSLREYLNTEKIVNPSKDIDYGMKIQEFSLDVGFDANVRSILDARKGQQLQEEQKVLEEKTSKTRDVVREREIKDRTAEREQDEQDLIKVKKPTLEAIADMKEKSNGAWKEGVTLFMNSDQDDNDETRDLLAGIFKNTKTKKGGQTNAS
jgi:hypothetical protein